MLLRVAVQLCVLHMGVRPVPELAWHRLFVARAYQMNPGVADGEDLGGGKERVAAVCCCDEAKLPHGNNSSQYRLVIDFLEAQKSPLSGGLRFELFVLG